MGELKLPVGKQPIFDHELTAQEEAERRTGSDKSRDRRVIERVSVPEMRTHLGLLRTLCQVATGFCLVYVAAIVAGHLFVALNSEMLARSAFVSTVVLAIAVSFARLSSAIKSYIENESKLRLSNMVERMMHLLFVTVSLGVILGLAQIITWIK